MARSIVKKTRLDSIRVEPEPRFELTWLLTHKIDLATTTTDLTICCFLLETLTPAVEAKAKPIILGSGEEERDDLTRY